MNSFADSINAERDRANQEKLLQEPARRAWEKLKEVPKNKEQYAKRWIWELLQNASDRTDDVVVIVMLNKDSLSFYHNGPFFKSTDIDNLIRPFSGKMYDQDKSSVIGQYGTGFLSTHILSGRVQVQCMLQNQEEPNEVVESKFELNRRCFLDWQNSNEMVKEIQKSIEQSRHYRGLEVSDPRHTFTYYFDSPLSEHVDCRAVAKEGIEYAKRVLPYVMSFIPRIKKVAFLDRTVEDGSSAVWRIESAKSEDSRELCFTIRESTRQKIVISESTRRIRKRSMDDIECAYEIQENRVMPYPEDMPRLFLGFPMIGSENTGLPVVVNSFNFEPSGTERSHITLSEGDTANRSILSKLRSLYQVVIKECETEKLLDVFNIARCKLPSEDAIFPGSHGLKWYTNTVIDPMFNDMLAAVVVPCANGFKAANELEFPKSNLAEERTDEWYDRIEAVTGRHLVTKAALHGWLPVVPKGNDSKYLYTETRYFQISSNNPGRFAQDINSNGSTFHAYRDLVRFVYDAGGLDLLREHASIPDATGYLRKLTEPIQRSEVNEPLLVQAYNAIGGKHYQKEVLHQDFEFVSENLFNLNRVTNETLARVIDSSLRELREKGAQFKPALDALVAKLFTWLNVPWANHAEQTKADWVKSQMEWFHRNKATLYFERFDEGLRNDLITISESKHLSSFSEIIKSGISETDLQRVLGKFSLVLSLLDELEQSVDDDSHADENLGEIGEELVYRDLKKRFPDAAIRWASKEGEPCFDFEISFTDGKRLYVDAKATRGTYSNAESNPIFLRSSQWRFLKSDRVASGYYVARVFLNPFLDDEKTHIEYLRLEVSSL